MSFITMINIPLIPSFFSINTPPIPNNILVSNGFPVTTRPVSNRDDQLAVHFIICIQQIQRNTTDIFPHKHERNSSDKNIDNHRLSVFIQHTFQIGKLPKFWASYPSDLLSVHRQDFGKISITIQESDTTCIYVAVWCFFQIITSQDTQTTE